MKKGLFAVLLILLLTVTGCGRKEQVGICLRQGDNEMTSQLEISLKEHFQTLGYAVTVHDAVNDQSRQNSQITRAVEAGCQLLIVEPVMTAAAEEILTPTKLAAVPVIFVNYEPESAVLDSWEMAYYIGSDLTAPGHLQNRLVQQLPDGGDRNGDGSVAYTVIGGPKDHVDAVRWTQDCGSGFLRLAAEHGDWSRDSGRALCRRQLARFGDTVDVIFCNSDELALGALEALQSEEKEAYLIGIGGNSEMLQQIQVGAATGTVCPDVKGLAQCIADSAMSVLNGNTVPKTQRLDFLMVTKDAI